MYMDTLFARMSVYQMLAWYPWRPEEVISSLELELQKVVNCHQVLGITLGSREEQYLTTEPSLQRSPPHSHC